MNNCNFVVMHLQLKNFLSIFEVALKPELNSFLKIKTDAFSIRKKFFCYCIWILADYI